jgi:hypothetical protein
MPPRVTSVVAGSATTMSKRASGCARPAWLSSSIAHGSPATGA